jgi:hypothetical protein
MNIRKDDIVKVANPLLMNAGVKGRTGRVVEVGERSCRVDITWDAPEGSGWTTQGVLGSFLFDELEVVESSYEREQVQALASILYNADFADDWDFDQAHAEASKLFKKGVRHEG